MTVTPEVAPDRDARVLMVLDSFNFGGAENLIAELGRFRPAGLELSVASLAPENDGRTAMLDRLAAAGLRPRFLSVRRLLDRPASFGSSGRCGTPKPTSYTRIWATARSS